MYLCNLAYRFAPTAAEPAGWLEGFSGCALTNAQYARENALRKIHTKLDLLKSLPEPQEFDPARLVEDLNAVTPAELEQLRADWQVSQQSLT